MSPIGRRSSVLISELVLAASVKNNLFTLNEASKPHVRESKD